MAALFNGFNWQQWRELPRYERVDCIAYFRAMKYIEVNTNDAAEQKAKRDARRR